MQHLLVIAGKRSRGGCSGRQATTGTITFTLSRAAKVELRFARLGKRGTVRQLKRTVRVTAKQGVNRIRFTGRLSRKVFLAPGAYRLTALAVDAAGARSTPVRTRFTATEPR